MLAQTAAETDVLIAGAGPTGLTLACELVRRGVRCRIIDKAAGPSVHSKALGVHARTLELLEKLEVTADMVRQGQPVRTANIYAGGRRLAHVEINNLPTPYPFILILPQSQTEQLLNQRLTALGGGVEWNTELTDLAPAADQVRATVKTATGATQSLTSAWLVGCDGAHSTVRHKLQLSFQGAGYEESFYLADLAIEGDLAHDAMHGFLSRDGLLIIFPLPAGRFRLVVAESPRIPPKTEPTLADFQQWMDQRARRPGGQRLQLRQPEWLAHFRIHRRQVPSLRQGRIFLAGDAAHIHSPAGGQGMNTSIQDAINLAWKLALVIRGEAREDLLDSYQAERHPVASEVLAGTDRLTRMVTLHNPFLQMLRNGALSLLTRLESVKHRLLENATELSIAYPRSPIVAEDIAAAPGGDAAASRAFRAGPRPGARAPDGPLFATDSVAIRSLFDVLRQPDHVLLIFAGPQATAQRQGELQTLCQRVQKVFDGQVSPYLVLMADRHQDAPTSLLLHDPQGQLHRIYGAAAECLYLIRPDGYIGYRSRPADLDRLAAYLNKTIFTRRTATTAGNSQ
jgi:2-polyprenyl-6-methoxyphenol hydroxylase-like FAD-dependent oxidoreductase